MSLDSLMTGVLSAMTPIITPDWGKLVVLIPALLTLVVLAYVVVTTFRWANHYRTAPVSPRASAPRKALEAARSARQIEASAPAQAAGVASAIDAAAAASGVKPAAAAEPRAGGAASAVEAAAAPRPKAAPAEKKSRRFWRP